MDKPQLSIVLACYNEASHLEKSFDRLKGILSYSNLIYEIIFVDDKSTDNTIEVIDNIFKSHRGMRLNKILHNINTGRGKAVTDGLKSAEGEVAGYIDADLEIDPVYIYSFYHAIERGYDAAIGERVSRFSMHSIPRFFTGRGYNMFMRTLINLPLHDTEAGIKFFSRQKLMLILDSMEDHHWFWDTEICARMYKKGYKIKEIPCVYTRSSSKRSTVKIIPDSIYYFKKLVKFRTVYKSL